MWNNWQPKNNTGVLIWWSILEQLAPLYMVSNWGIINGSMGNYKSKQGAIKRVSGGWISTCFVEFLCQIARPSRSPAAPARVSEGYESNKSFYAMLEMSNDFTSSNDCISIRTGRSTDSLQCCCGSCDHRGCSYTHWYLEGERRVLIIGLHHIWNVEGGVEEWIRRRRRTSRTLL